MSNATSFWKHRTRAGARRMPAHPSPASHCKCSAHLSRSPLPTPYWAIPPWPLCGDALWARGEIWGYPGSAEVPSRVRGRRWVWHVLKKKIRWEISHLGYIRHFLWSFKFQKSKDLFSKFPSLKLTLKREMITQKERNGKKICKHINDRRQNEGRVRPCSLCFSALINFSDCFSNQKTM